MVCGCLSTEPGGTLLIGNWAETFEHASLRQGRCSPASGEHTCFGVRPFPSPKSVPHGVLSHCQTSPLHEALDVLPSFHVSLSEDQACDSWPDGVAKGGQVIKLQQYITTLAQLLDFL